MNIRRLVAEDTSLYQPIRLEALQNSPEAFASSFEEEAAEPIVWFGKALGSHERGDFVLGAFDPDDTLIGIIGFHRESRVKLSHKGNIWGMYVRPECRRRGVGKAMLEAALNRVGRLPDLRQINVCIRTPNDAALRLYEQAGFHSFGLEQGASRVGDRFYDACHMQLFIESNA